jgi:hypothetical protein
LFKKETGKLTSNGEPETNKVVNSKKTDKPTTEVAASTPVLKIIAPTVESDSKLKPKDKVDLENVTEHSLEQTKQVENVVKVDEKPILSSKPIKKLTEKIIGIGTEQKDEPGATLS